MPWDILSKALLKSNTPPLSHCASHFNTEGNQVGPAWFALFSWCHWVLPVSLSFKCLEMTFRRTLHSPPQEWCKADWAVVPRIFHLACFKNSCNICSFLVIEIFLCLWKTDACPQHSQALIHKIQSSSLAASPWPADLRKPPTVSLYPSF